MNGKTTALLLSGLLAACAETQPPEATVPPASSPPPAPAPAPAHTAVPVPADHIVNIRGAGCEDLLRLSPEDRAAASMFYIGDQASRLRARTINVSVTPSIEAQAVVYCEENPRLSVFRAFAEAYLRTRR